MEILSNFGTAWSTIGPTFGLIGSVVGLIGIVGGLVGYFGKSRGDSIIAYQAREIELGGIENARLEKANAALTAERDSLQGQVEDLKGLAQGSPQLIVLAEEIKKLTTAFSSQFKETRQRR